VLLSIGRPHEIAHGSLRLSICEDNTIEEMQAIVRAVKEVVEYLRSISPVWTDLKQGKQQHII
jgi:cysteine desulfurase